MNTLLTAIVLWLASNFGLPAIYDHPRIEFVPPTRIAALRYSGFAGWQPDANAPERTSVVAVYLDATRTIYLPEGWAGKTPAELSVLVHEMVHHLQNVGKLKFECPQQREQLAYRAQEQWLGLFGRDLLRDFELDPLTLLVRTKCSH
jgi:hypothetical protein